MRRLMILTTALGLGLGALGLLVRQQIPPTPAGADLALGAGGPVEQWPVAPPLWPDSESSFDLVEQGPAGPLLERILDLHIQPNQTLYDGLLAAGIRHDDIMSLVKHVRPFRDLRKVRAGERFRLELGKEGDLAAFGFDLDLESWIRYVRLPEGGFEQQQGSYPVERRMTAISGVITTSLYESLQACKAPTNLAAKMNDILGWDLDFSRDPRRGDRFRIIYEELYKDGQHVRTGAILACDYHGQDRQLSAYHYTLPDGKTGYFDREGRNLQKQLMRAPLNYSRISSGFSYNRRHPVLGRNMPHLGIDYAAPVGTPVWAAGDGTVVAMGNDQANGRYVRLRHTNREYETYYLHFSRFARGLKVGAKVRQGEVIGYVGATGYATGPHLDFRVKKGGQFVNPRTLKLPPAEPIPAAEMANFLAVRMAGDAALKELSDPLWAPVPMAALTQPAAPPWSAGLFPPAASALPPLLEASN